MTKCRALALVAIAGAISVTARDARAEFPTLPRAIESARSRAIVVAEAEAELGVANAQMAGARVSSFGNPYTEIQVDRGWTQPNAGERTGIVQAMSFTYFPVDWADPAAQSSSSSALFSPYPPFSPWRMCSSTAHR